MERLKVLASNNQKMVLGDSNSLKYLLNAENKELSSKYLIKENTNIDLLILNFSYAVDVYFELERNSHLHLSVLANKPLKTLKISANVAQNAVIECYYADFVQGECKGEINISLNESNASCDWHLASLTEDKDKKSFDVSVFHNSKSTFAQMDNYGVIRDDGKLTFSGICHIKNGSSGSKAHQNAKIMVFDELSNGIAKPILKIDENDIEASHAAVVGKINDEHIFYLTSRGLSIDAAKRIITLGYLKPILKGFDDEDIKKEIENLIEGKM